ncbi:MAG: amidohydrolase family protein [Agathobacter sp.]|nr:amidohydrolase family protein [Agathobacter sp.]
MLNIQKRIDSHIHYSLPVKPEELISFMDRHGIDMANLVLVPNRNRLTSVPDALMAKVKYPDRFFVFTSFDVSEYFKHGKEIGKYQAKFVDHMRRCGCDGLKIIEGKPSMRKMMGAIPDFDKPCWEPLWEYLEETQFPVLWHLNDPESCWGPEEEAPRHIRIGKELYDETFVNNEDQYRQMEAILQRHPKIKFIFAHMYFMSAQLPRLSALLDTYPNVMVDITPGLEIYVNLSKNTEEAKRFFEKYQDRIFYGTDIGSRCVLANNAEALNEDECVARMDLIDALFDSQTHRVMKEDGRYLINTDDFLQQGFSLSEEALNKVYWKNFQNYVATTPAKVNPKLLKKECRRIITTLKIMSFIDKSMTPDMSVAKDVITFLNKNK